MRLMTGWLAVLALSVASASRAQVPHQADQDAINQLIDRYGATEDAMDMTTQAQLIAPDRVWIGQGAGRRTDQATNMRIQQAAMDQLKKLVPGIQTVTEDRDRLVKFYGNGTVAVASFYRYQTVVLPPGTPREVAQGIQLRPPAAVTLVLEKRDGAWKIVHTHFSNLGTGS